MDTESTRGNDSQGQQYTAVVYFHGMGSQRRHAEVSGLVEALEAYDRSINPDEPGGRLKAVRGQLEASRVDPAKTVPYIELEYRAPDHAGGRLPEFRFYEVFWAPLTAGGVPLWNVVSWLSRQVLNPWRALGSVWRARARYRTAVLYDLWFRLGLRRGYRDAAPLLTVLRAYDEFEGSHTRSDPRYARGTFEQFCGYLGARRWEGDPGAWPDEEERRQCLRLAHEWRRQYNKIEWMNALVLTSLLLGLLMVFLVISALAAGLVQTFLPSVGASLPVVVLSLLTVALGVIGVRSFFQNYLGDVVFWSTYEETDERYKKRSDILACAVEVMRHVLEDERCGRVAVVGHSLGSAIAYDTMLELGRYNRARVPQAHLASREPLPLQKIEHLITYGSPVDKIHYFFQNDSNERHRYHRVLEAVRGDMALPPLADNRRPRVHWINFFDSADIISGPIQTPQPLRPSPFQLNTLRVDNVQVSNGTLLPQTAHVKYLENLRQVVPVIFACVLERERSFVALAARLRPAPEAIGRPAEGIAPERLAALYEMEFLEQYQPEGLTQRVQALALSAIWLIGVGLIVASQFGPGLWPAFVYGLTPSILKWGCVILLSAGTLYLAAVRLRSLNWPPGRAPMPAPEPPAPATLGGERS